MMRRELSATALMAMGLTLLLVVTVDAQPFLDDFEDGHVDDNNPVTWVPTPGFATGLRYVTDGSYILQPQSSDLDVVSASHVPEHVFGDVSLRCQLRWLGATSSYSGAGLTVRSSQTLTGWNAYIGGIGTDGLLFITELVDSDEQMRASRYTSLDPTIGDVHLQFDVIGASLSLFAWQDGTEKPAQPQLRYVDTTNTSGMVGFGMRPSTDRAPVAIRYFAAVPEPSSAVLGLLGLVRLLILRRRRP